MKTAGDYVATIAYNARIIGLMKKPPALVDLIDRLNNKQRKELDGVLLNTLIAYEAGGDWKAVLQRARNKRPSGLLKQIYDMTSLMDEATVILVSKEVEAIYDRHL